MQLLTPVDHQPAAVSADCPWIRKVGTLPSVLGRSEWAVYGVVDKVVDGIYDVGGGLDGKATIKFQIPLRGKPPANVTFRWSVIWSDTDPDHKAFGYQPKLGDKVVVAEDAAIPAGCLYDSKLPDASINQGAPK